MAEESIADQLHDWLVSHTHNAPHGTVPPIILPTNKTPPGILGLPPLPPVNHKPPPPITGNPYCKLHRPHQVNVNGVGVDIAQCDHCSSIAVQYGAYFDKAVARYTGSGDTATARAQLKFLLMALACSESGMDPLAKARDDYDNPVAYGLMQIYHTNLASYGLNPNNAAADTPAALQKNINAGADIFMNFFHYYAAHPDAAGAFADAVAAYKGWKTKGSHTINWNGKYSSGKTVKQTVTEVLTCWLRMAGALKSA